MQSKIASKKIKYKYKLSKDINERRKKKDDCYRNLKINQNG